MNRRTLPEALTLTPTDAGEGTRTWRVLAPLPAFGLTRGDTLSEWVPTHSFTTWQVEAKVCSVVSGNAWPAILAAFAAGRVRLQFALAKVDEPDDQADLVALHGPARAVEMIWADRHQRLQAQEIGRAHV